MFLPNKYTIWYYNIINNAINQSRSKKQLYLEEHHIIPRCMGGNNDNNNLVLLTPREHFICHWLLVKMVDGVYKRKLSKPLILFKNKCKSARAFEYAKNIYLKNAHLRFNRERHLKGVQTRKINGSYPKGKENNFAKKEIINMVKQRMIKNNPMKNELQIERMKLKNPNSKPVITPLGEFPSLNAALRAEGLKWHPQMVKLMNKHPNLYYFK